jgi:CxxC-x17-CxxC domain-containing protein
LLGRQMYGRISGRCTHNKERQKMAIKKAKTTKKKTVKKKIDAEELMGEVQARFKVIEEKLDTLLSKTAVLARMVSTEHDPGFKTHATVTKKFPIPQDRRPRERKMHKVVCADCKTNCEVPFVPRADRPVYCRTCFSNRRNESRTRNIPDRANIVEEIAKTLKIDIDKPLKAKAVKTEKTKAKTSKPKKAKPKVSRAKRPKTKKTKAKK